MTGTLQVVVGGQFGSEGKGAVGAQLAREAAQREDDYTAVRVAGPNAGHSAYDPNGNKWALRQIPVAGVANIDCQLIIGAGSEVDPEVLMDEITRLDHAGLAVSRRLAVDTHATLIEPRHRQDEASAGLTKRIGSTGKGIGAARADRVMRTAELWGSSRACSHDNTANLIREALRRGGTVMIEGTQGYGLGQSAGYYPHCTSSECRAIDFLSMAGVSPWDPSVDTIDVWVTLRTYPIRVAGASGPMHQETSWEELAHKTRGYIAEERTTVTQKVRRVGTWDAELAAAAVAANGGDRAKVALTFFDYWYPELAGITNPDRLTREHIDRIDSIEQQIQTYVRLVGTGPNSMVRL